MLHTAGVGESALDEQIADLEALANPTVGLSAHPGQVDVRITAKAESKEQAEALIRPVENVLRERLGAAVYGADEDRLPEVVLRLVAARGWGLVVVESGTEGAISAALASGGHPFLAGEVLPAGLDAAHLEARLAALMEEFGAQAGLSARLESEGRRHLLAVCLRFPGAVSRREWSYGGSQHSLPRWVTSLALDWMRRQAS